ncbi:protein S-acyltransferase [Sarracenia purpurea var. burkii]
MMASIKPQPPQTETETDPEAMEAIALSDPPETEPADRSVNRHKNEVEADDVLEGNRNILVSLRAKLVELKRVIEHQWLQKCSDGGIHTTRAYQVWPGNNVLFRISS